MTSGIGSRVMGTSSALIAAAATLGCSGGSDDFASTALGTTHAALTAHADCDTGVALTGVNLAGADFGEGNLPGTYEEDYIYPSAADVDPFLARGANVFRVPFRWERLQPVANGELDVVELARLDGLVSYITSRGATVVLDPHNYARYFGQVVGVDIPASALGDFWGRLAAIYRKNRRVIFGLMNEPNTMPTEVWLDAANVAIAAIRSAHAYNLVLVPGNAWTGARQWDDSWYGTPNAVVMTGVVDPAHNFAFDVHQYFDSDASGTYGVPAYEGAPSSCESMIVGTLRVALFTAWLRATGNKGFVGELGVPPSDATCLAALDDFLATLDENSDVFLGWTYWAAGPWWGDYPLSVQPNDDGSDKPQMAVLAPYFGG
jgi:endoglucanase